MSYITARGGARTLARTDSRESATAHGQGQGLEFTRFEEEVSVRRTVVVCANSAQPTSKNESLEYSLDTQLQTLVRMERTLPSASSSARHWLRSVGAAPSVMNKSTQSQANVARARATVKFHVQITLHSDLTYDGGRGRVQRRSKEEFAAQTGCSGSFV